MWIGLRCDIRIGDVEAVTQLKQEVEYTSQSDLTPDAQNRISSSALPRAAPCVTHARKQKQTLYEGSFRTNICR
jgi:hypothetical protein